MILDVATLTDAGPRPTNEDEVAAWEDSSGELVVLVADGLGGMGGGRRASQLASVSFRELIDAKSITDAYLLSLAEKIHAVIRSEQEKSPELATMATTLSAGVLKADRLIGVHCGDTRISVARGDGIRRLTVDHTEAQKFLEKGKLTKQEFFDYPRKNILYSALGIKGEPRIDTFDFIVKSGDKIVFTSDGVHGLILLREMREVLASSESAEDFVQNVRRIILERGPEDNFSVAAIFVK